MAIRLLSKFKMPTGTRDEGWLSKATSVRMVLASLWRKLREDLTMIWRQAAHLEVDIEVLRAMLSRYEMTEQLSRWAAEKQRIVSAANSKRWTDHEPLIWEQPDSIEALQDKPRSERLETTSNQDDKPAQDEELTTEAFKNVSIQGSSQSSVNYGQSAPRLMDAQTKREQEKLQPRPRHTLTKRSLNVIQLMFQAGAKIEGQSNGSSSCPSFLKWVLWRYAAH